MTGALDLKTTFPFISSLGIDLRKEFEEACTLQSIKQGTQLTDSGASCRFMTFVLAGRIKIFKLSPEGREITLFRVT